MREVSLRMELLDRQVVDADGLPFARVDDVEIELGDGPAGEADVTRFLCSQEALGVRLGGITGSLLARSARRLRASGEAEGGFSFVPDDVERWEPWIRLRSRLDDLAGAAPLERWLRVRAVRHLPGAGDEGE